MSLKRRALRLPQRSYVCHCACSDWVLIYRVTISIGSALVNRGIIQLSAECGHCIYPQRCANNDLICLEYGSRVAFVKSSGLGDMVAFNLNAVWVSHWIMSAIEK